MSSAATNAHPNESTSKSLGSIEETSRMIPASSASTARNPSTSVNGSRSAATIGGSTAFITPIRAAVISAPARLLT